MSKLKKEYFFSSSFSRKRRSQSAKISRTAEDIILSKDQKTLTGIRNKEVSEIVIPDGVTEIGESAFYDCTSLTSVVIPDSVTEIGESAFKYCTSLTSVVIPYRVTEIGDGAFEYCTDNIVISDETKLENVFDRNYSDDLSGC